MIATFPRVPPRIERPRPLWVGASAAVAIVMTVALVTHGAVVGAIGLLGVGGLVLFGLTVWRPAMGCAVLTLAVPLTAGLGRNTVVPLFRTSEAVVAIVGLACLVRFLPRKSRVPFTGLDIAVAAYCLCGLIVPALVLIVGHVSAGFDVWRVIFAPAQYLLIYLVFSRSGLTGRSLFTILNLAMAASVVVAAVGLAQLADVPGVRSFIANTFPLDGTGEAICQLGVCRPDSLLEHWSAFGGFALLNLILALALAAWHHSAFPRHWLTLVMAANAVGILASQTQAVVIALVIVVPVVVWQARRVPRQLLPVGAAVLLGLAIFWPQVSARIDQQLGPLGSGASSPTSLATRFRFWGDYFLPTLADHVWTGTGTVIPSDVPAQLTTFVDNEYLRLAFRAGVIGVAALLIMLLTTAIIGWRTQAGPDPTMGAIGATAVGYVVALTIMGATGEYLTYAGIAQQFWMVIGVLTALGLARVRPTPAVTPVSVIDGGSQEVWARLAIPHPRWATQVISSLRPDESFFRSSAIVFAGNTTARFLGLIFSVVAARLLLPAGYGVFAYALAIVNIAGILVGNAQQGLSRSLSRSQGDSVEQDAHFTNWVVVAAIVLGFSLLVALPLSMAAGLQGLMLAGVAANLLSLAVFQIYREAQRGLERYGAMVAIYLIANLIQLLTIIALAAGGYRSPAGYLVVYGLSSIIALLPMQAVAPLALHFVRSSLSRKRIDEIRRFIAPLFLQTAFFSVWINVDLILVDRLMSPSAAGKYAAAKTLVNGLMLVSTAITVPLAPRVARMRLGAVPRYAATALRMVCLLTVPLVAVLVIFSRPLSSLLFGSRYAQTAEPLAILAIGMGLYALYSVLEWSWIARGHPTVDTIATGAGMVAAVVAGLVLVPRAGLAGAAIAFTVGAAMQLIIIGAISLFWLRRFRGRASVGDPEVG